MVLAPLDPEAATLVSELQTFNGCRTVWLDPRGRLWHAEPEEELESEGFRYVATVFRPGVEELCAAVARCRGSAVARSEYPVSAGALVTAATG